VALWSSQGAGTDGDGGVARIIRFLGRSRLCRVPPSMASKGTEVEEMVEEVEGVLAVMVVLVVLVVVQVGS